MKRILIIVLTIFFISCNSSNKTYEDVDTTGKAERLAELKDSLQRNLEVSMLDQLGDTTGVYKSPIKVIKSKVVKKEYSSYKDIELTFKNISNKTVTAIRFAWVGFNAFSEPADLGNPAANGYGGGFSDQTIRPNKTNTLTWNISSRDVKKITKAWAYEVVFEDGTKWKLKK